MDEKKLLKRKHRAKAENNKEQLANTHNKLGDLYFEQDRFEEALEEYKKARELLKSLGKQIESAVACRLVGECYSSLGDYKEALIMMKEYFDISREEGDLIEKQRALASIGRTYFLLADSVKNHTELGEFKRALKEAKQAFMLSWKVCEKITNISRHEHTLMRSRLMQNFGMLYEWQGDIDKAIDQFRKAIAINMKSNLFADASNCYSSLASLYYRQKNSELALKNYDHALDAAEHCSNNPKLMCETLCGKAEVYFSVANFRAAKQTLEKARNICKRYSIAAEEVFITNHLKAAVKLCDNEDKLINMPENEYESKKVLYDQMGDSCLYIKNVNQAINYYQKMLECCEALGCCGKELVPALVSLSKTYRDAGMYDEALKFFSRELEICEDNAEEAFKTCLNIVDVLKLKGVSRDTVMDALKKALDYALIAHNDKLELKILNHILKFQEENGLLEDARETQDKIDLIKDDKTSSSSDLSEDEENLMETPDWMDEMSLSDALDEPVVEKNNVYCPRPVRRPTQGLKLKRNEKGETQLQVACIAGNYNRVKQLIDLKHPVNVNDNSGWTPLHEVCNYGFTDLVELLLDNGANINDPGADGCEGLTPLHDACSNGHLRIVEILLDRGASHDVKTNNNKTPYDFLMEWYSRARNLTSEDLKLFESLRERLKKGLETGLYTEGSDTDNALFQHPSKQGKKRNERSEMTVCQNSGLDRRDSKRRWTAVNSGSSSGESSDEETKDDSSDEHKWYSDNDRSRSISPMSTEENATLEYQNAIKALRKPFQEPAKKFKKTAKSVFIEETDTCDDWLIDDLKDSTRPNKRRKTKNSSGDGMKLIGTLRRDVTLSGEHSCPDVFLVGDLEEKETFPVIKEAPLDIQTELVAQTSIQKKPQQSCLLDSGFTKFSTEKQVNESGLLKVTVLDNEAYIQTVKIHIENTFFVVPLPPNEILGSVTIDWLAKEAAKRFLRLEGREPVLVLLTKDGATLAAEDPVAVINEDRELLAQVISWKSVSLLQRYKDVCVVKDFDCDTHIEEGLQSCDTSGCLNLGNCGLYADKLAPLIQSLHHEFSLRELILGGNALMDEGIEMFSSVKGLPALEILDISCNNISSVGLVSLLPFLNLCQSLKLLDLSFNDLEDKWFESICSVCTFLQSLSSLNLESCNLSGEDIPSNKHMSTNSLNWNLERLNISYNPLGELGLNRFLCYLNPSYITHLNVAGTTLHNSTCANIIVEFFKRGQPDNLLLLDLSDSNVNDSDLMSILGCLKDAKHLKSLALCNNGNLSSTSMDALYKMPNMPAVLDLCGCDNVFTVSDNHNIVSGELLRKLCSLTITCKKQERKGSHWQDTIQNEWRQIWGDRAKVFTGPSGLLKLHLMENEV